MKNELSTPDTLEARRKQIEELKAMMGHVRLEIDLDESRRRLPTPPPSRT